MQDVTQFIVIAPASMGKAVEYAEQRITDRLARSFPDYEFQLEPYGPFAEAVSFAVVPIMNQKGRAGPNGEMYMCRPLEPWVIPAIKDVLREFELSPGLN